MKIHDVDFELDEFKEREIILNFLKNEFQKDSETGIPDEIIAKRTRISLQKVSTHCKYLADEGYLEIWNRAGTVVWYLLKSKGLDAVNKEYNTEYQKNSLQERKNELAIREKREKEEKEIENQRHKDNIDVQKESNKWAKWGVITALVFSLVGIIISVLAYLKD